MNKALKKKFALLLLALMLVMPFAAGVAGVLTWLQRQGII